MPSKSRADSAFSRLLNLGSTRVRCVSCKCRTKKISQTTSCHQAASHSAPAALLVSLRLCSTSRPSYLQLPCRFSILASQAGAYQPRCLAESFGAEPGHFGPTGPPLPGAASPTHEIRTAKLKGSGSVLCVSRVKATKTDEGQHRPHALKLQFTARAPILPFTCRPSLHKPSKHIRLHPLPRLLEMRPLTIRITIKIDSRD